MRGLLQPERRGGIHDAAGLLNDGRPQCGLSAGSAERFHALRTRGPRYRRGMTTAALPSVDWIHLAIGDDRIDLTPAPGIQLRLIVEPVPDDRPFGVLDKPRPGELRVSVDLIPAAGPQMSWADAVAACESMAARLAAQLGATASPLTPLREFSLEAALGGEGVPYNRVSVPRLTIKPSGLPLLDEDQPLPGVRVFTATARSDAEGVQYVLTRKP